MSILVRSCRDYLLTTDLSNILQLPFRRSHSVSLADAITQYISDKYDQRPDMFADDLLIIDRLRTEAINVKEPHVSGISRLVTYAAQLKWLGGKFPVDVRILSLFNHSLINEQAVNRNIT